MPAAPVLLSAAGVCGEKLFPVRGSSFLSFEHRVSSTAAMPELGKESKQRLQKLFKCGQFTIRWGFIPLVLYLGFKRGADPGMPEPNLLSLLWG